MRWECSRMHVTRLDDTVLRSKAKGRLAGEAPWGPCHDMAADQPPLLLLSRTMQRTVCRRHRDHVINDISRYAAHGIHALCVSAWRQFHWPRTLTAGHAHESSACLCQLQLVLCHLQEQLRWHPFHAQWVHAKVPCVGCMLHRQQVVSAGSSQHRVALWLAISKRIGA